MENSSKRNSILLQADQSTPNLNLSRYTPHIREFFIPNPLIYWVDFILSNLLGNLFLFFSVRLEAYSFLQIFCIFLAAVFLYRALIFVHEDLHLGKKLKGFSIAYNLIFGFLHKFPSYTYPPHIDHHSERNYGTINDPEYEALADKPAIMLFLPIFTMFLVPGFLILRYGFLPLLLPFIGKKNRIWIYTHASTFMMNIKYHRRPPTTKQEQKWYLQDMGCFLYNALFFILMLAQILPWKLFWVWYFTMYLLYVLNFYRASISHTYLTGFQPTTHKQQILDSTTLVGLLNEWWCPVGLRYHALHHMYPSIPYHNLGKAHKRLIQCLPDNHPYRLTLIKGFFDAIMTLIKRSNSTFNSSQKPNERAFSNMK